MRKTHTHTARQPGSPAARPSLAPTGQHRPAVLNRRPRRRQRARGTFQGDWNSDARPHRRDG